MKQVLDAEKVNREYTGKDRGRKQLPFWVGEQRKEIGCSSLGSVEEGPCRASALTSTKGQLPVSLRLCWERRRNWKREHTAVGRNCHCEVKSHCWGDAHRDKSKSLRPPPTLQRTLLAEPGLEPAAAENHVCRAPAPTSQ